jgi:hypothetical protein
VAHPCASDFTYGVCRLVCGEIYAFVTGSPVGGEWVSGRSQRPAKARECGQFSPRVTMSDAVRAHRHHDW